MISFTCGGTTVTLDETTLACSVSRHGHRWQTLNGVAPTLQARGHDTPVNWAKEASISHERRSFGTGEGVVTHVDDVCHTGCSFATFIWVEASSGDVICEWIPGQDGALTIERVNWPVPFAHDEPRQDWRTLITHGQGTMIPNSWPTATSPIAFDGRFETEGGTMPWFAQLRDADGYIAICETPWNAGYAVDHPAGGPYTHVGMWFEPSLGRMDYRRVVRLRLLDHADIASTAKEYRRWADEHGHGRTLAEKAVRNPSVRDLAGRLWVHVGAKTHVRPDSRLYDADHPERNDALVPFGTRARQLKDLAGMGADRLFMHLDGWGQPGYDNQHPDYLPACVQAGGWEGLKTLADTAHAVGAMFGLHDQYRDYYLDAATFDEANAVRLADGTIPTHANWAGGPQSYLCARLAPDYVKRNYREIAAHGVKLDCTYLDVFTCNEGDECANPAHRMTRRECYAMRSQCFSWLLAQGILTSSEEASDWAMDTLVFCHYAPYDFQLAAPDAPRDGVPVPLQNLVWHDCVIEPWMMDRVEGGEDYMLYALLNGGAPYLIRDAAYAGIDGDLGNAATRSRMEQDLERCRVVANLHRRVALQAMTDFGFIDGNMSRQWTQFADGTRVSVNLTSGEYVIEPGSERH